MLHSMRTFRGLTVVLVALVLVLAVAATAGAPRPVERPATLAGQLLVAAPNLGDPRFRGTVIYLISHDADGAMGLVVNRAFGSGPLQELLQSLGVGSVGADREVRLHYGGPVEPERGVVLHTADYAGASTHAVADGLAVSFGRDILEALAIGRGPRRSLVLFGYAGWGPGQLESEMARDDWLSVPADGGLIFADDLDRIWQRAFDRAGTWL
jgi:putative transcriptional regulator